MGIDQFPQSINSVLGRTTSQLSQLYKQEIIDEVEPLVRNIAQASMVTTSGLRFSRTTFGAWSHIQRQRFNNGGLMGKLLGTEGDD